MKKNIKRFHDYVGKFVSSTYIEESVKHSDKPVIIDGKKYYHIAYIACAVSKNKRSNNDWFNCKKSSLDGKITGGLATFVPVVRNIELYVKNQLDLYGNVVISFMPTDDKRDKAYIGILKRVVKKFTDGRTSVQLNLMTDGYYYIVIDRV